MNTDAVDNDPLSQYDSAPYNPYYQAPLVHPTTQPITFPVINKEYSQIYNPGLQDEPHNDLQNVPNNDLQNVANNDLQHVQNNDLQNVPNNIQETVHSNENVQEYSVQGDNYQISALPEEEDIKPDISLLEKPKRARKPKGKTSSYWNKKIADKDFKFYGCSVCNIAFQDLTELDSHVLIHNNRITSYDIRLQNIKKRKRLKKEKKKKKKEEKEKNEVKHEFKIEIKPEDGYIGTETTDDFNKSSNSKENVVKNDANNGGNVKNRNLTKAGKDQVYKCFACNKTFALSYYLKIHVRSHTDEKPYTCSYCGENFITASKMGRHTKRIHLSIRNQCRICYKFFNRFELLTKHFDKKHADQKLEGEPYDYNVILPYLAELEEQFKPKEQLKPEEQLKQEAQLKSEGEPKLEREDTYNVQWLEDSTSQDIKVDLGTAGQTKVEEDFEKEEKVPVTFEFAENEPHKLEEFNLDAVKEEPEVYEELEVLTNPENNIEVVFEQETSDDDIEPIKEERAPTDDEEYFPPDTWARSPPGGDAPFPPSSPSHPSHPPRQKEPGVCQLCNRTFSSKSYLKVHLRTHTGEKPYSCYVCGRAFITASKMHLHVLTHQESWVGEGRIKPEGTVKSEDEPEDGDAIGNEKKQKKVKSKIDAAKAKLLKKTKKKRNPQVRLNRGRPHNCEYCGKKFLHIETLQVHLKSHEGEVLVLKCSYCLEPQPNQESKSEHEATHTGPKPYLCTICGRQYQDRGAMIYHRKTHGDNNSASKVYQCDICSKAFNSQTKLQRHIVAHTTKKFSLRYECPVCANMFNTRWHIQMHLKSHQREGLILEENRDAVLAMVLQNARKIPKPEEPSTPGQALLAQAQALLTTQALAESAPDERSRICNICGQVFQHFYYLEEHLKTHGSKMAVDDLDKEEEKKHTCQVCAKSFKLHYYLKLHSFTHTKEKPFICQQCGKGFITRGKLKRHLETHQGLKKYQCHVCYKFFTRPSYLRIHIRTIHGTQDYNFRDYGLGVPVGLGVPLAD